MNPFEGTFTTATDDRGITLADFQAAMEAIEALLPVAHYLTSKYAPIADTDGKLCVMALSRREHLDAFGATGEVSLLVIVHPDNLEELKRRSRGKYHMVALPGREQAP